MRSRWARWQAHQLKLPLVKAHSVSDPSVHVPAVPLTYVPLPASLKVTGAMQGLEAAEAHSVPVV